MYLCVCHAVTDRQVRKMVQDEGHTLSSVYRELGFRPSCAACVPFIKQAVRDAQQGAATAALAVREAACGCGTACRCAGSAAPLSYGVAAE